MRAASMGLWAVLAARVVPTILYVRARLQLKHGETPARSPIIIAHVGALAVVVALALSEVVLLLAIPAILILLLRAAFGFSECAQRATAKQIGIRELAYGALTVLAVAAGHFLGW